MKIFKCDFCGYETIRKTTLIRHLNRMNKCYESKVVTTNDLYKSIVKINYKENDNAIENKNDENENKNDENDNAIENKNDENKNDENENENKNDENDENENENAIENKNDENNENENENENENKNEIEKDKPNKKENKFNNTKKVKVTFNRTFKNKEKKLINEFLRQNKKYFYIKKDYKYYYDYITKWLDQHNKHLIKNNEEIMYLKDNVTFQELKIFYNAVNDKIFLI